MKNKKITSIVSSTAIILSLFSTNVSTASANSISNLEQEKRELEEQSNELQGNIQDAEKEMESLEAEKQQLSADITELQENIETLVAQIQEQEDEIVQLEEKINKLNEEIKVLQSNIEKRNEVLAEQARGVQITGSPQNLIDLILSAENLSELMGKFEVINALVNNNNTIMEEQIKDKNSIESNKEQINQAKSETENVKAELEISRNNLVNQRAELDSKIQVVTEKYDLTNEEREALSNRQTQVASAANQISSEIETEQNRIAEQERIAKANRKEAARKAAEQAAVRPSGSNNSSSENNSSGGSSSPTPAPENGGWMRPASGRISSEFGMRKHPITGNMKLHAGIDIAGGGSIVAAKSGTVTTATYNSSFGYHVKIDHGGGITTLYAHMQPNLRVSAGQSVSQGQQIGTMGSTGSSTGVHLHFEVHQNGTPVNPRKYVSF